MWEHEGGRGVRDDGGMIKAKVRRNLGRWGQRKDECERKRLADLGILVPIGPLHRMLDRGPDDDDDSRNGEWDGVVEIGRGRSIFFLPFVFLRAVVFPFTRTISVEKVEDVCVYFFCLFFLFFQGCVVVRLGGGGEFMLGSSSAGREELWRYKSRWEREGCARQGRTAGQ